MLNNVSVIIPVYNAEKYLEKAVYSVLLQPEVDEIVLVEDNSPDNCLQLCKKLAKKHLKITLLRHPDKKNHGAGASRNLGIKQATCNYIAFLDADDFYLPQRFQNDLKIFNDNRTADGIYNAVGFFYYSQSAKKQFDKLGIRTLTTVSNYVSDKELPSVVTGISFRGNGYPHLNGLTLKKDSLKGIGLFDITLNNCQDTEFIFRLANLLNLQPGKLKHAVALRGVHDANRTTVENLHTFQPSAFNKMGDFIVNSNGNTLLASACYFQRDIANFKNSLTNKNFLELVLTSRNLFLSWHYYHFYFIRLIRKIYKTFNPALFN